MLIWLVTVLALAKVQLITSQFAGNLIEAEYSYGLSEFQDSIDWSRENLTETEIAFLSEQINLMVLYGESLIKQSKQLFDNYGFIVDAKRIYFFVLDVRGRIKGGINSLIDEFSSSRIERKLSKVFRLFSMNLKAIVDVEIVKIQRAVNREEDALECWEIYKLLMFELGFDAINELQLLSLSTAVNLVMQQESMKRDVSSKINQLIAALSESHSTLFEARSRINTYIEDNQQTMLDQIDFWFQQIATSLQQATENVQRGTTKIIQEAKSSFVDLSREIADCMAYQ